MRDLRQVFCYEGRAHVSPSIKLPSHDGYTDKILANTSRPIPSLSSAQKMVAVLHLRVRRISSATWKVRTDLGLSFSAVIVESPIRG